MANCYSSRMSIEVLNTEITKALIIQNGWKIKWVVEQLGEGGNVGNALIRDGRFPKDPARKAKVLRKLSKLLGVGVGDLLLTLEAKESA